ncbi:MAG: hypothetical protein EP317_02805 [Bacillota bacterium]|nr:MAG: hypothetical protein EP317_02805 [Bacillota bacterium]
MEYYTSILKRSLLFLVTFFILIIILAGCQKEYPTLVEYNQNIVKFGASFGGYYKSGEEMIYSYDEYVNHELINFEGAFNEEIEEAVDIMNLYSETFFEQSILLFIYIEEPFYSEDVNFELSDLKQYNEILFINVVHQGGEYDPFTSYRTYIFIEVDRSSLKIKNDHDINVLHLGLPAPNRIDTKINFEPKFRFTFRDYDEKKGTFNILWRNFTFKGTFEYDISDDFEVIEIKNMLFSEETPNVYGGNDEQWPTEGRLLNYFNDLELTFEFGDEVYINSNE